MSKVMKLARSEIYSNHENEIFAGRKSGCHDPLIHIFVYVVWQFSATMEPRA